VNSGADTNAPWDTRYIVTGDESWFVYLYLSDHMFASERENVIPREKQTIGTRKIMLTIFSAEQGLSI
jgi:hypothetical protein